MSKTATRSHFCFVCRRPLHQTRWIIQAENEQIRLCDKCADEIAARNGATVRRVGA